MAPARKHSWKQRLAASAVGCCAAFALAEIFVRCYPPLETRFLGGRLRLPYNRRIEITNEKFPSLDPVIMHSTNSLGFRGPEPPGDFADDLTIVAVGGSTTECYYLDDRRTWPARLAGMLERDFDRLWINNAGFDGHSTCGHQLLVKQFIGPLRPKVVLYLIGINEVGNSEANDWDQELLVHAAADWPTRVVHKLADYSALAALAVNIRRHRTAQAKGLVHATVLHDPIPSESREPFSDEQRQKELNRHRADFLPGYESRLRHLVRMTRDFGIEPVLLTQPVLCGTGRDDATGADLALIPAGEVGGETEWAVLELYNDVTRRVAEEESVLLIDLAYRLPKSSRYFYDWLHYNNAGAEAVAEIVDADLAPWLAQRFPQFRRSAASFADQETRP